VSSQIDYGLWLDEIKESNYEYASLFMKGKAYPPIFFFGNPDGAVAATVGVNPSAGEFAKHRRWDARHWKVDTLLGRCRNYFNRPAGVPPHPWFELWEEFLDTVGLSYETSPRVIHLDFSPRATRSMSSLQKESKYLPNLFLKLVENDLKYFIEQLQAYPSIEHLYLAGSVTKKYYGIEFLAKKSVKLGVTLRPLVRFERGSSGQIGLYELDAGDSVQRYLFFCSTSPSARVRPHPLRQKAHWLIKRYPRFSPS